MPAVRKLPLFYILAILLLAGCMPPRVVQSEMDIRILVDKQEISLKVLPGSTVQSVIQEAGVSLGEIDRVNPAIYTVLRDGDTVTITRIEEEFEIVHATLPFDRQIIHNDSLPEDQEIELQKGKEGQLELTYRKLYEDGVEINSSVVKEVILEPPIPQIIMVGVQRPYAPLPVPGRLVYLYRNDAWIMEGSTSNRRQVVSTGDLDGRIFTLSPDGEWLLFSRKSTKPIDKEINTLWIARIGDVPSEPVALKVSNVVHFAEWNPIKKYQIAYSLVEPRSSAPGWQANNDLYFVDITSGKPASKHIQVLETNAGGIYGWWGSIYAWSNDGQQLAYARPDGVGLVEINDKNEGNLIPLMDITPLQTRSDWAWIPGIGWGSDNKILYVVNHGPPPALVNPEESPVFDLNAISLSNDINVQLIATTGMFAHPQASPLSNESPGIDYRVAYMQAVFPQQSSESRYRLVIIDRDGSNRQVIFPPEGLSGLDPQIPVWAPRSLSEKEGDFVALIYRGNLWLVDVATGQAHQVTGDGNISRIDWK